MKTSDTNAVTAKKRAIPVRIPIGRRYTATVTQAKRKKVQCERCDQTFKYYAVRTGHGFSDSFLWLDNAGAEQRALDSAENNCKKALARAVDIRPCPHCGWYQENMVVIGKRKRLLYIWAAGFTLSCFTLLWAFLTSQGITVMFVERAAMPLSVCLIFGILWYFLHDPNAARTRRRQSIAA